MNRSALFTLTFAISAFAATPREYKPGKVMDTATAKRYIQTGASSTTTGDGTVSPDFGAGAQVRTTANTQTDIRHTAMQDTSIVIAGADIAYTVNDTVEKTSTPFGPTLANRIANRKHGCQYIVGDAIQYVQEKSSLWVKDANGKECKLDILRQERVAQPAK